jgi:hypothetical protein
VGKEKQKKKSKEKKGKEVGSGSLAHSHSCMGLGPLPYLARSGTISLERTATAAWPIGHDKAACFPSCIAPDAYKRRRPTAV